MVQTIGPVVLLKNIEMGLQMSGDGNSSHDPLG